MKPPASTNSGAQLRVEKAFHAGMDLERKKTAKRIKHVVSFVHDDWLQKADPIFWEQLGTRLSNVLRAHDITLLAQVIACTAEELEHMQGMGRVSFEELQGVLQTMCFELLKLPE